MIERERETVVSSSVIGHLAPTAATSTPMLSRATRRLVLCAHVALTLAAADDADTIRPRLAVVAGKRHLAMSYVVVDASIL